jgi:hypothetical protein
VTASYVDGNEFIDYLSDCTLLKHNYTALCQLRFANSNGTEFLMSYSMENYFSTPE